MKKQNGITLIALVITIIVLLILAGVSIAMLTGENGILNQATTAKSDTEKAEVAERINMELNAVYSSVLAGDVKDFTTDLKGNLATDVVDKNLAGKATVSPAPTATVYTITPKDTTLATAGTITIDENGKATISASEKK